MRDADNYIFYSTGGYDYLEYYLVTLYGEARGSFRSNIRRYYSGAEYQSHNHAATKLEEMEELSEDMLRAQIIREHDFQARANSMIRYYDDHCDSLSDEDILGMAGDMGFYGGRFDWYDTFFPHAANLFVSSEDEAQQLLESRKQMNIFSLMVRLMIDGMREGQVLMSNGRRFWNLGYARNYYRGENAFYASSRPSMFRNLSNDPEAIQLRITVSLLEITQFGLWLNSLQFAKEWPVHIFHGAVAQHYGIPTSYMDVTSDLKTALFFACCKYEDGAWRPLRDDEFSEKGSRKHIEELGGDARYAILFAAPADIANMSAAMPKNEIRATPVKPIGYQPFMRCANQKGYVIEGNLHYNMFHDTSFARYKIRLTRNLCDWIFQEMDGGKAIYGNDPIIALDDIVETIRSSKCFSRQAWETYLTNNPQEDESKVQSLLQQHGYKISDNYVICTKERMREIEDAWSKSIPNNTVAQVPILQRPMFIIK